MKISSHLKYLLHRAICSGRRPLPQLVDCTVKASSQIPPICEARNIRKSLHLRGTLSTERFVCRNALQRTNKPRSPFEFYRSSELARTFDKQYTSDNNHNKSQLLLRALVRKPIAPLVVTLSYKSPYKKCHVSCLLSTTQRALPLLLISRSGAYRKEEVLLLANHYITGSPL